MNEDKSIVLYDGVCCFCHASVQFIIKRDPKAHFQFAALQSEVGRTLAGAHGIDSSRLDGLVLIDKGAAYEKSSASLRIARRLSWPWPILFALIVVPRPIRDWFYDRFAKRRYRWFGKMDECPIPDESIRFRFLTEAQ